jgi:outer membrane receptor protein involved in Fe transport
LKIRHGTFVLCFLLGRVLADESTPQDNLQEIVVTATLHAISETEFPGSVTVLGAQQLRDAGQQHFEDVLALIPNFDWAGDTSRPRYFQIRGIGELQQYQGAPNPSVGFLIDDIDFSGLGSAATLFDLDRIEVLRGPQGTVYGANALAGLIYVKSAAPEAAFGGRAEVDIGNYNTQSYGAVLTGPVPELDSEFRLAVQRYTSDGYYYNAYLHRDTDERDELTVRARWRFQPADDLRVDVSLLRAQMDDGYDAFSIDNSRTVESDQPGMDVQNSNGVSARAEYTGWGPTTLTGIATYADSGVHYSYDGDWGNPILWAPYTYRYEEAQYRYRSTRSLELRLGDSEPHGFSWLFGIYGFQLRESLSDTNTGLYVDPYEASQNTDTLTVLTSEFESRTGALYGQIEGDIGPRLRWSLGLRGERQTAAYGDVTTNLDAPSTTNRFEPVYDLWGGHASLDLALADGQHVYALLARGYKAGGFNLESGLPADEQTFTPETDLNMEIGYKFASPGGRVRWDTSVFYMQREHEQLLTGTQTDPDDPDAFIFYTGNARAGYNEGVESTAAWRATRTLEFGGSLGLLRTEYSGFVQNGIVLPNRSLPDAPNWQAAVNATWRDPRGPYVRIDVTGMAAFYYDMPPNPTASNKYGLVNAKLGWEHGRYEIYWWGRNLLDKTYTVRGFYFGDVPPNFPNETYVQLGDPRTWGVHLTARF